MPIYHPLHIYFLKKLLNQICLVCKRFKEKEFKKGTFEEQATWMEMKRQLNISEFLDIASNWETDATKKAYVLKTKCKIEALNSQAFALKRNWAHISEKLTRKSQLLNTTSSEILSTHVASYIDSAYADYLVEELDSSESSDDGKACKWCGANIKNPKDRYPNLVVTLSKMKDNSYETIEMKASVKEGKLPLDYWNFVCGNPERVNNTRPLLPFEAYNILQSLSKKVIQKLGMDEYVARPEALILHFVPVPPSGSRITEVDFGSSLPRTHMDKQHKLLQRLSFEVKRLQSLRTGMPDWATTKNEVMELQLLASSYLTGSKWEHGLNPKAYDAVVKSDVQKSDRYMKGHILAKTNNSSARMIVVGDPSIKIEEILLPVFLVEQLTIPEKVTAFNIERLQRYVDNGPYADLYKTGAVFHDRPGRDRVRLHSRLKRMVVEIGDTVHRHIKDGDLVIVNRPPSLTKHAIMAMEVRLHHSCSLAINPLICAPFQADFDGDCMHLFVPQTSEAHAEAHELLKVSNQLINPQGGQSNSALTEDSRLGAYLMTSSCIFLNKMEVSQLSTSSLVSLPIPAILKSPNKREPLWTGQQLYSTILPEGICYKVTDKKFSTDVERGILISNGELLVCNGNSNWLGDAFDALTAVIHTSQGPAAALVYLNRAQELANLFLRDRGFSVGLQDFQLSRDRSQLLRRRLEEVSIGNREALFRTLLMDEHVQREELNKNPASKRGLTAETECIKSKGLYLGATGIVKQVEALDKVAVDRFQTKFRESTKRLAKDYCKRMNPLLVMINAGSKGSMSKLVQQTISVGLQLFKGEHLLPLNVPDFCQKQLTDVSTLRATDFLQFERRVPSANLSGYWESRGIITSSYLDGLSPLQFFIHTLSSRYGIMRSKVEEPNLLLKRLLLFLRNLYVEYDGSVRSLEGQQIVQFKYGRYIEGQRGAITTLEGPKIWCEAGEPVGILAATAITEPAYQLKLDSPHNVGAKAIGPLDLINETLSPSNPLKLIDRRVLLRFPLALKSRRHGQENGAMRILQHLKPVSLSMVATTTMIEYRKAQTVVGEHGRSSPWVGHIRLGVVKLKIYQLLVADLVGSLETQYTNCKFASSHSCQFGSSGVTQEQPNPCIHFFVDDSTLVATLDDKEYDEVLSNSLEVMKNVILPILLRTPIKGDARIESVNLLWEDMEWNPRCTKYLSSKKPCKNGTGELVLEVTVKKECCKSRGKAWKIVTESCLPIMQLLDWQRCTPYSIQELNHVFGLEAAKGVLLQRLELAIAGMGKPVNLEHLELIADTMVTSGKVSGASLSGYKDLCKTISRSAPFSTAAFLNPKNSFVVAGRHGISETMEGALSSSVWGKAPSLGTGSNFEFFWQAKAREREVCNIREGFDIHEYLAKLNSSALKPCEGVPVPQHHNESQCVSTTMIQGHCDMVMSPDDFKLKQTNDELEIHLRSKEDFPQVGNHNGVLKQQASSPTHISHPPVTDPIRTEGAVTSRSEACEDSSSFHTPNETLELTRQDSSNSSPCSSFRKDLFPTPVLHDDSEGDETSGIV
ncbi:DNA-directed RNA polymerase IV subunit 1 isoform X2 [Physcomitrium patens]|nr:DNA-directed RNA polymerase IV subunit 1-like isoform X3 [Physcomitrium patens]|eukprot:XP_024400544.1 DNA-directed RNA polymerase IV subunit 1-like isoform X3 [Physcomitrella patens]